MIIQRYIGYHVLRYEYNYKRQLHGRRLACVKRSTTQVTIISETTKIYLYTYLIYCFNYREGMYTILHENNQEIKSQILIFQ